MESYDDVVVRTETTPAAFTYSGDDMLVAVVTDSPNNGSNSASSSTLAQGVYLPAVIIPVILIKIKERIRGPALRNPVLPLHLL